MLNRCLILVLLFVSLNLPAQEQISNFSNIATNYSDPSQFTEYHNLMFFEAFTEGIGRELWCSDGTATHTSLLKDINPGVANGMMFSLRSASAILNDELFFIANDGSSDGELWKTNGTPDGTVKVTSTLNSNITKLTRAGNALFFLIKTNDTTLQLWKSDGTTEGTVMVKGGIPIWNKPTFQGKCNDTFIFTFQPAHSNESRVWRSDGTENGTFPITELLDGDGAGQGGTAGPTQYIEYKGALYFVVRSSEIFSSFKSVGIMKTDGTLENTVPVIAIHNGNKRLITSDDVTELEGKLYFSFFEEDYYRLFIWESDGTAAGTNMVYDESGNRYFMPSFLSTYEHSLLFCGKNPTGGTSPILFNVNNHAVSYLPEIADSTNRVLIFFEEYDACTIKKLDDTKYLLLTPIGFSMRDGWILNPSMNTTTHHKSLDSIADSYVFNQSLYYTRDWQLWKFDETYSVAPQVKHDLLNISPNPATDFIKITSTGRINSIRIYTASGLLISVIDQPDNFEICISRLRPGVYYLACELEGSTVVRKFIKQ